MSYQHCHPLGVPLSRDVKGPKVDTVLPKCLCLCLIIECSIDYFYVYVPVCCVWSANRGDWALLQPREGCPPDHLLFVLKGGGVVVIRVRKRQGCGRHSWLCVSEYCQKISVSLICRCLGPFRSWCLLLPLLPPGPPPLLGGTPPSTYTCLAALYSCRRF